MNSVFVGIITPIFNRVNSKRIYCAQNSTGPVFKRKLGQPLLCGPRPNSGRVQPAQLGQAKRPKREGRGVGLEAKAPHGAELRRPGRRGCGEVARLRRRAGVDDGKRRREAAQGSWRGEDPPDVSDFIYAYGLAYLPVSTSAILISTQLAFTVFFAFLIVRQRLTAASVNAVALLTVGAIVLGLHVSSDRPAGVTRGQYWLGFFLTLGAAALYGLVLPLIELAYKRAAGGGRAVTYALVMEMQLVMGFFATAFCTVGMIVNRDFQAIPREARAFQLGEARYYTVLIWSAILWQFFFLGTVGVIFCVHTLLAGILIAVFIPVTEVAALIFLHEKFSSEKGVALVLSLWGLASYSYGEYSEAKAKKKAALEAEDS